MPTLCKRCGRVVFAALLLTLVALFCQVAWAVPALADSDDSSCCYLSEQDYQRYQQDGTLEDRLAFQEALEQDHQQTTSALIQAVQQRSFLANDPDADSSELSALSSVPSNWKSGMPSVGTAKVVGLRIAFPDYSFDEDDTLEAMDAMINASAESGAATFPYESLHAYYQRASYGKLDISGTVYDYTAQHPRDYYTGNLDALYTEALQALDATVDFSQFDGNKDGIIDAIYLHFAGPNSGWATTWWSSETTRHLGTFDGVETGATATLHESSATLVGHRTVIHETGHVLGLPDLYSYSQGYTAYRTGTLTWDLMETNQGDTNAYFKWLLGWIDDDQVIRVIANDQGITVKKGSQVVASVAADAAGESSLEQALQALSTDQMTQTGGFMVITNKEQSLFSSFLMVQYDIPAGNQPRLYWDEKAGSAQALLAGFRVYNVNAQLNNEKTDWEYRNTDGLENANLIQLLDLDIDKNHVSSASSDQVVVAAGSSDGGFHCYLAPGESLSPKTRPSTSYRQSVFSGFTGLTLTAVSAESTGGTLRIAYSPKDKPDIDSFTFEPLQTTLSNQCTLQLKASWGIETNGNLAAGKVKVGDQEYDARLTADGETLSASVTIPDAKLEETDTAKLVIPANTIIIGWQNDAPIYNVEMSFDLNVGPVLSYDASGQVGSIVSEAGYVVSQSNVISVDGMAYAIVIRDYKPQLLSVKVGDFSNPTLTDLSIAEEWQQMGYYRSLVLKDIGGGRALLKVVRMVNVEPVVGQSVGDSSDGLTSYNAGGTVVYQDVFYWIDLATGSVLASSPGSDEGQSLLAAKDSATMQAYSIVKQGSQVLVTGNSVAADGTVTQQKVAVAEADGWSVQGFSQNGAGGAVLVRMINDSVPGNRQSRVCVLSMDAFVALAAKDMTTADLEAASDLGVFNLPEGTYLACGLLPDSTLVAYYLTYDGTSSASCIGRFDQQGNCLGSLRSSELNEVTIDPSWNTVVVSPDGTQVALSRAGSIENNCRDGESVIVAVDDLTGKTAQGEDPDLLSEYGKFVYNDCSFGGTWVSDATYLHFSWEIIGNPLYALPNKQLDWAMVDLSVNPDPEPDPDPDPTPDPTPTPDADDTTDNGSSAKGDASSGQSSASSKATPSTADALDGVGAVLVFAAFAAGGLLVAARRRISR